MPNSVLSHARSTLATRTSSAFSLRSVVLAGGMSAWLAMLGCQPEPEPSSRSGPPDVAVSQTPVAASQAVPSKSQIESSIDRNQFDVAESMLVSALLASPSDATLHGLLGDLRMNQHKPDEALAAYRDAVDLIASSGDSSKAWTELSIALQTKIAQVHMAEGRPYDAVAQMRRVVTANPSHANSRRDLVGLLSWTGMQADAKPHLQWLVQRGLGEVKHLGLLANLSRSQASAELCRQALAKVPADLRPEYGLAMTEVAEAKWDSIARRCDRVLQKHPDFTPARALLTRAAVERNDSETLRRIAQHQKSDEYFDQSRAWTAWGLWAEQQSDLPRATAALLEAIRIEPNDGEALSALTRVFAKGGNLEASKVVADRLTKINLLNETIDSLGSWKNNSQVDAIKMSDTLLELGRPWEAIGWIREAAKMFNQPVNDLKQRYTDQHAKLSGATPWQLPEFTVDHRLASMSFPIAKWRPESNDPAIATLLNLSPSAEMNSGLADASNANRLPDPPSSSSDHFRLENQAIVRGLDHVCRVTSDGGPVQGGLWIWQSSIGAAGVIDFDLDGFSDVVLTAADGDPGKRNSTANSLFHNRGGQFVDVSAVSGLADIGFTQGVGVGDYNADGFADCMVANIGGNRLYRNNGDGTFSDVTDEAMLDAPASVGGPLDDVTPSGSPRWTSSIAFADMNADGIGDFVEVNYCAGDAPYTQRCFASDGGRHRSCQPLIFPAQADRLWLGRGDGAFAPVNDDAFRTDSPGRGLGVVVGQFDDRAGLDVYVANDMTANHFWTPIGNQADRGQDVGTFDRWEEQAIIRGLASDGRSQPQASMGIAAADMDGDLDLDFSVTHFTDEYNTLYRQISPGFYVDATVAAGLADPTRAMLGFGTQFADLNVDGRPELLVANGNVDDFAYQGKRFRMPMQLFALGDSGRWHQVDGKRVGGGFDNDVLARAVATIDADRDGRVDFVVSHLSEPTQLWVNQTRSQKRPLAIRLVGTHCDRDAVGATVTLTSTDGTAMAQRMSGNGYQCSNESLLRFAVPRPDKSVTVNVAWPDGRRQTMTLEPTSSDEWLIVQAADVAFPL